jgi:16S rRNA A1518/A1519 N6-dimethyltransferase RsmA/KsgA/DIM1 with predicted DNA glycosylase/AP lyase activity
MNLYRWDAALSRLPENKKVRMAEVGVWTGRMSEQLLKRHKKLRLIQIDRWREYSETERKQEDFTRFSLRKQEYFDRAKLENLERTKIYKKRIRLIEKDSILAINYIKNHSLNMVFIDALHSYQGCSRDILLYLPKIKKGGP